MNKKETAEYWIWRGIKARCLNPRNPVYKNYGGRGITIAAEWINSFDAFLEHIGFRPTPRHSVDRIDNDGPYAPGNVRWATRREQRANTRSVRPVTLNGTTKLFIDWCRELDIDEVVVRRRLKRGMSIEDAFLGVRKRANARGPLHNAVNRERKMSGVRFDIRRRKWRARIRIKGAEITLGSFVSRADAETAVLEARERYGVN